MFSDSRESGELIVLLNVSESIASYTYWLK